MCTYKIRMSCITLTSVNLIVFAFLEQLEAAILHLMNLSHLWSTDSILREPGKTGRGWSRKGPGDVMENVGQETHRLKTDRQPQSEEFS